MQTFKTASIEEPLISIEQGIAFVRGDWSVRTLSKQGEVKRRLSLLKEVPKATGWNISEMGLLDSIGGQLLWDNWGGQQPKALVATSAQSDLLSKVESGQSIPALSKPLKDKWAWIVHLGQGAQIGFEHAYALAALLGQLVIDLGSFIKSPRYGPWREISAQIFRTGTQALAITALVGFLIGVVLSYLSGQQLASFGAGHLIVKLLGISIVRELGPVLAAILVAGRSGSAMTAQIGVMRVTQELDAMAVMGIESSQRLILPRVIALALTMPLLILWTDAVALLGGMYAAKFDLGIKPVWFISQLPTAIGFTNYAIGILKGLVFGAWVALAACHFGLRIEPNTESLGKGTTASVVTAITGVILIDALFAIMLDQFGF
jgi:phospholipid/cholesterol/gamma-HCH transport system permease protein